MDNNIKEAIITSGAYCLCVAGVLGVSGIYHHFEKKRIKKETDSLIQRSKLYAEIIKEYNVICDIENRLDKLEEET